MRVFGNQSGISIVIAIALIVIVELMSSPLHRWRKFEWLVLAILAIWYILRNKGA